MYILQNSGVIEGSLEVKLPTIWTDGKAAVGRVREHFKVTMWKTHHDLLEVAMSKKFAPLWPVKTRKALHVGSTFGRSTAPHETTTTTLHYIPLHPAVVGEVTTQPLQKAKLQPPFGPSADSLSHPCITKIHPSHGFLSSKLPPPPCAVLLVLFTCGWYIHIYIYIYITFPIYIQT